MILQNFINKLVLDSTNENPLYLRNLIKEELQNYVLNFVFTSEKYNGLIFTGGTCLRKVYGLNRLSEDLDFDYTGDFSIEEFAEGVEEYFKSVVQYSEIIASISGNKNTAFFKFPILKELEVYSDRTPEDIFVRCDFSKEEKGGFVLDKNMITAGSFQFFVTSYDLPTLFANKLVAFLERAFYRGEFQKIPFKGRDVYDLFWLTQLSGKSSYNLKMSGERLSALLPGENVEGIKKMVVEKVKKIDDKFLYDDLFPLLGSKEILDGFIDTYKEYLPKYIGFVL